MQIQASSVSPGNLAYAAEIQRFLSTGKVTRLPPGKPVPTEVFIDRFKLNIEQRLRLWRAGG